MQYYKTKLWNENCLNITEFLKYYFDHVPKVWLEDTTHYFKSMPKKLVIKRYKRWPLLFLNHKADITRSYNDCPAVCNRIHNSTHGPHVRPHLINSIDTPSLKHNVTNTITLLYCRAERLNSIAYLPLNIRSKNALFKSTRFAIFPPVRGWFSSVGKADRNRNKCHLNRFRQKVAIFLKFSIRIRFKLKKKRDLREIHANLVLRVVILQYEKSL